MQLEFEHLEEMIAHREVGNSSVSGWNIGWHIEHSLMVVTAASQSMLGSNPADYKWSFSIPRLYIMDIRRSIPRGRARAPKAVQPKGEVGLEQLQRQLRLAKIAYTKASQAHPHAYFPHPYFGLLKRDTALRFMALHTRHHIKIMQDILKTAAVTP